VTNAALVSRPTTTSSRSRRGPTARSRPDDGVAFGREDPQEQLNCSSTSRDGGAGRGPAPTRPPTKLNEEPGAPVDELERSVRSANCLQNANIKLHWRARPEDRMSEMLKTKNFGRKSLKEIRSARRDGPAAGMKLDNWPGPNPLRSPDFGACRLTTYERDRHACIAIQAVDSAATRRTARMWNNMVTRCSPTGASRPPRPRPRIRGYVDATITWGCLGPRLWPRRQGHPAEKAKIPPRSPPGAACGHEPRRPSIRLFAEIGPHFATRKVATRAPSRPASARATQLRWHHRADRPQRPADRVSAPTRSTLSSRHSRSRVDARRHRRAFFLAITAARSRR